MRISIIFLILIGSCCAQEIKRPTVDADAGNNLSLGCFGQLAPSPSMPFAYDAAGQATSSSDTSIGSKTTTKFSTRAFSMWAAPSAAYLSLTLNINWSATDNPRGGDQGQACAAYSIDGGAHYTSFGCDFPRPRATSTVTLSPTQNLATIKVAVCVQGSAGFDTLGSIDQIVISDIWTVGTTTAPPSGTGSSAGQAQRGAIIVN